MNGFDYRIVADPEVFLQNRLPAHSDHLYYNKENPADMEESDFRQYLNGTWKFSYADHYASAVKGFERDEYDCRGWKDIHVPGHIQLQGYDRHGYVNTQYPWDGHEEIKPHEVPTRYNPTATYVKYFELPEGWNNRPVYISFQGAESGLALWLNGQYVGYAEDSFTPSEFDLTPYIRQGENKLAAQVFRWTGGSWLEDQDFFRFSGIFRDVYLYTVPDVHVRDMKIRTDLDDTFAGAKLRMNLDITAPGQLRISLVDGQTCLQCFEQAAEGLTEVIMDVAEPHLWSAEDPYLYDLRIEVRDRAGAWQECIQEKVGFRRFEIRDAVMLLNGQRIVFNGVNRHDFSAQTGRCVSNSDILKDLVTMKRHNINAVRTSHYPNPTYLYRMCDRLGLYMIDETNIETHGIWDSIQTGQNDLSFSVPGDRPEYLELICDRARSMIERDKNHAAILMWSLGNESLGGSNFLKMSQMIHEMDDTRIVHYEGVAHDERYPETTDVTSTMYTTAEDVRKWVQSHPDKPYILCEYAHAMGNSCGALHKYTELAWEEKLYQGGFIWDYIDQSMTLKDRYGRSFQGYGGDFGERPADYNFSGNGIVYGEHRDPSPKMQEVKSCYQNAVFTFLPLEKDGDLTVQATNRHLFTDLNTYDAVVTLEQESRVLDSEAVSLSCAPLDSAVFSLPVRLPETEGEYIVTLSLRLKEDTAWAKQGHETAWAQTVLICDGKGGLRLEDPMAVSVPMTGMDEKTAGQAAASAAHTAHSKAELEVIHGWHNLGVRGDGFEVLFSKLHGGLVSYIYGGRQLLTEAPKPNFWRCPTDNDAANLLPFRAGAWKSASSYQTTKSTNGYGANQCVIREKKHSVEVSFVYHLPVMPAKDCTVTYEVFADGEVQVDCVLEASAEIGQLPELSMILVMDADYSRLTWYGLGPEETYVDRCHAKLGVYSNEVADNMAKYLRPQECGNHMAVRTASVTDDQGRGLAFRVNGLQFSALPYAPQVLENARHPQELPEVLNTYVRIGIQQGVGGDDTWGAPVHPEYLLDNSRPLRVVFSFKGI